MGEFKPSGHLSRVDTWGRDMVCPALSVTGHWHWHYILFLSCSQSTPTYCVSCGRMEGQHPTSPALGRELALGGTALHDTIGLLGSFGSLTGSISSIKGVWGHTVLAPKSLQFIGEGRHQRIVIKLITMGNSLNLSATFNFLKIMLVISFKKNKMLWVHITRRVICAPYFEVGPCVDPTALQVAVTFGDGVQKAQLESEGPN